MINVNLSQDYDESQSRLGYPFPHTGCFDGGWGLRLLYSTRSIERLVYRYLTPKGPEKGVKVIKRDILSFFVKSMKMTK